MYRTRQYRIGRSHTLYGYCKEKCLDSANLYNRANYILRQYATSVDYMNGYIPLFQNQMEIYRLVKANLSGTKYLGDNKWLTYNALDYLLKITRDKAYYSLPAQSNQQILKLLLRDYKSYFEAVKAYREKPASFSGCPRLPRYVKSGCLKTTILTNQICRIRDGDLKFPGVNYRLLLGLLPEDAKLKEVRIKPCGSDFVIEVILDISDKGIIPRDDKAILAELSEKDCLDDIRVLAIDPGTDNIVAVVNNFGQAPFVIKGGVIKAINQYYNKELARLSTCAITCNKRYRTRRMNALTEKRNRRIKDQFHKISRQIVNYARDNHVNVVVMGHNFNQKREINIGHVNNQNFMQIPMMIFAGMLRYKLSEYGIQFVLTEESYTSKADYLANDNIPQYGMDSTKHYSFSGRRIKRGLYKHYDGTVTNADINGAANILRKVFPKVTQWDRGIVDMPCSLWSIELNNGSCRIVA